MKKFIIITAMLSLANSLAYSDVQYFTTTDSEVKQIFLNAQLSEYTATNLANLDIGTQNYNYMTVQFTPSTTGLYNIGISASPFDPLLILYNGIFDATKPGFGGLDVNDNSALSKHKANGVLSVDCGGDSSWCPAIDYSLTANQDYTFLCQLIGWTYLFHYQ